MCVYTYTYISHIDMRIHTTEPAPRSRRLRRNAATPRVIGSYKKDLKNRPSEQSALKSIQGLFKSYWGGGPKIRGSILGLRAIKGHQGPTLPAGFSGTPAGNP